MSPDLEKLITLQEIDLKIQQLKTRLANVPAERKKIEARFDEFAAAHNEVRDKLEAAQAERKQVETELADTQRHLEKYKEDLMKVRNEKEYTTCLREIDSAKKSISQLESQTLQLMEEMEKLEAELGKFSPEIESRKQELDQELAAFERELAEGEQNIEKVVAERNQIVASMPKPLIAQYERVAKLRQGVVLAEVRDRSCSACRMKVRPQAFTEVKRGERIIECESCSRILFYRETELPETAAASD